MNRATLNQLRTLPLFTGLSDEQLVILEAGETIELLPGTIPVSEGERFPFFCVILAGEVRLSRFYGPQEILIGVMKQGMFMGEVMLLLDIPWLVTARIVSPVRLLRLHRDDFWRMLSACPTVAHQIFKSAGRKMHDLEGYRRQREKLASLGTMAAGLAHELNNPAAAAHRAAAHLRETTDKVQTLLIHLAKILNPDQWQHFTLASQDAVERLARAPALHNLDRNDREESIAAWLAARGVAIPWELSPILVSADLGISWLEELARKLPAASLPEALALLESHLNLKSLLNQIEHSTGRVANLVKAVKSYTYMDQSPKQEVDIQAGVESTLTMLGHKLKNVTLTRVFDPSIPRLMAYGSELNQVWTNLIDNAIDAVNGSGQIWVRIYQEDNQLVVEIVDNGPGIPPEVQAHLFEPFYTTKPVGSGTGLGLLISSRIVADLHRGEIEFETKPGETHFKVRLPIRTKPID
jgi:signal transduction histidine kinase